MDLARPTLIQFRFSHFNEKARWALDYKGVGYDTRTLLPGMHARALRELRCKTTPVLICHEDVLGDSSEIIAALEAQFPEPNLFPADPQDRARALEIEDYCDRELGPPVRHCMFCAVLPVPRFFMDTFAAHLRGPARWLMSLAIPMMRGRMKRDMNLTSEAFKASREQLAIVLDKLEAMLDGGDYFVGDRFSVADLTAAALLSPMALPPEAPHVPNKPLPVPIARFLEEMEDQTPMLQWARETFRKHRGERLVSPSLANEQPGADKL